MIAALSVVSAILISCGEHTIDNDTPNPPVGNGDTIRYNLSSIVKIKENLDDMIKNAGDSRKFIILNISDNMAYMPENLETMQEFGKFDDKANVEKNWNNKFVYSGKDGQVLPFEDYNSANGFPIGAAQAQVASLI